MSVRPSRLFDYQNRQILDDLRLNAFASDGSTRKPVIPPELMYQPFRQFLLDAREPLFSYSDHRMDIPERPPSSTFFQMIPQLLRCIAARYEREEEFTASMNRCFSNLLGIQIEGMATPRPGTQRKALTDGGFLYQTLGACRQFVLIRQDKLASGCGGGDSLVELLGHVANIAAADPRISVRPTILIEVIGHRLVVSLAAVNENNDICVTPAVVSHTMLLQAMPSLHFAELAATFVALRRLIVAIARDAVNMPRSLVLEEERIGHNLVFAKPNGQFEKYLRLGERYGKDAHDWCASRSLAPPFEEDCFPGWTKITMSDVDGTWELATLAASNRRAPILEQVQLAVKSMNAAGFVHGDVRCANVLFQVDQSQQNAPEKIMLIDFDDAGRIGQTYYSLLPFNPELPCPPEAVPGGEVAPAHDVWRSSSEAIFYYKHVLS